MHPCFVCFEFFNRDTHVPRVLFCGHAFCTPCLNSLSKTHPHCMETIKCPMCRKVTCLNDGLPLEEVLWVEELLMGDDSEDEDWETTAEFFRREKAAEEKKRRRAARKEAMQLQCNRIKLRLQGFLKTITAPRQSERIARGCNVTDK